MNENRPSVVMYFTGVAHPKTPMEVVRGLLHKVFSTRSVDHSIHILSPSRFGDGVWLAVYMPAEILIQMKGEVKNLLTKEGVFKIIKQSGPDELSFDAAPVQDQPFPWVEVEVIPASLEVLAEVEEFEAERPEV